MGTGSDRILIVGASLQTVANRVTGVDWDPDGAGAAAAEALTKLGSSANSSDANAEIWYLVNPTSGTGEITADYQGSPKARSGAHSFFNVDQTTPLGSFFSATGLNAAPTVTVTGVAEGEVTVDTAAVKGGTSTTATVGSGQTKHWNGDVSSDIKTVGSRDTQTPDTPTTASVIMSWSLDDSIEWAIGAVAVKPVNATAVKLSSLTATQEKNGVLVQWRTGWEVDNLGFHVYRQEGGQRIRLTPELIAGSAFLVGEGTALRAGHSYRWWDPEGRASTQYWLEDVDLNGQRIFHGPVQGLTVGEAVAKAKAAVSNPDVRRTWIFFGDPLMRLP